MTTDDETQAFANALFAPSRDTVHLAQDHTVPDDVDTDFAHLFILGRRPTDTEA